MTPLMRVKGSSSLLSCMRRTPWTLRYGVSVPNNLSRSHTLSFSLSLPLPLPPRTPTHTKAYTASSLEFGFQCWAARSPEIILQNIDIFVPRVCVPQFTIHSPWSVCFSLLPLTTCTSKARNSALYSQHLSLSLSLAFSPPPPPQPHRRVSPAPFQQM